MVSWHRCLKVTKEYTYIVILSTDAMFPVLTQGFPLWGEGGGGGENNEPIVRVHPQWSNPIGKPC